MLLSFSVVMSRDKQHVFENDHQRNLTVTREDFVTLAPAALNGERNTKGLGLTNKGNFAKPSI